MKWGLWSTTAATNSNTPPDGWPEGQAPSTVNDCAREMMAQIRTGLNDLQYIDQGLTPTFATTTMFTVPGNQLTFFDVGRRVKALGAATTYGTVISSSFTTNTGITLRMDSGVLDASLTAVGVSVMSGSNPSLPDYAFKPQNVLTNPYLDIWQRGNGPYAFGTSATPKTTADMFLMVQNTPGSVNVNRVASAPSVAQAGILLNSCIQISVSAVGSVAGGSAYAAIKLCVEGADYEGLAQKPNSFQFWVSSNRTGTYCVAFQNSGADESLVLEYSISSVSTWEKKTFSLPASPSAGTWDYSSGTGLRILLTVASGATLRAGAGNWTAVNAVATSNQTNFMASVGNVISFTGFKLNDGPVATPLEPRPFAAELEKVSRYNVVFTFSQGDDIIAIGQCVNTTQALVNLPLKTTARAVPSAISVIGATVSGLQLSTAGNTLAAVSAVSIYKTDLNAVTILATLNPALLVGGNATTLSGFTASYKLILRGAEMA